MSSKISIELDDDAADCVVIQTLKSSIKNIREVNRKFPPHPEDLAYKRNTLPPQSWCSNISEGDSEWMDFVNFARQVEILLLCPF